MPDQPIITIENVHFTYPAQVGRFHSSPPVPALRGVSLNVAQGEYLALLGHNGSGKSTLARMCNALLVPERGRVLVAGRDTADAAGPAAARDVVGMVFQNPDNQIIATRVEDDVAWALAARGYPADRIRERVDWALAAVGIAALRNDAPHRLSGGQRQRLAVAGVLALRPQVLVADEITAMLDPLSRAALVALLHDLHRTYGLTIIHVTHLLEEIVQADRVVALDAGQVALAGPPATIFADLARLQQLRLNIPEPIALAARLRAAGVPISPAALTVEAIADELARLRRKR
jgi:energy-coupling factor transporter ATPase